MENSTPNFKPNYLKTLREKINQAKRFDQLYERPNTDDWAWYDCERSEYGVLCKGNESQHKVVIPKEVINSMEKHGEC
mgnify:CR=1 FL=1